MITPVIPLNLVPQEPLLRAEHVTLEYASERGIVRATDDVSFDVHRGDRFVLLGPSGCGKSTLLKAIGGFIAPRAGSLSLSGKPITGPDRTASSCSRNSTSCRHGRRCGRT